MRLPHSAKPSQRRQVKLILLETVWGSRNSPTYLPATSTKVGHHFSPLVHFGHISQQKDVREHTQNRRALQGRYPYIAQGLRPGLINGTHLLSPFRGGTPLSQTNARAESAAPHRSSIRFYLRVPRVPYRALPSFHPGLCRSVVPTALIMCLDFDALALHKSLKLRKKYLPLICLVKGDHCIVRHSLKAYPL